MSGPGLGKGGKTNNDKTNKERRERHECTD